MDLRPAASGLFLCVATELVDETRNACDLQAKGNTMKYNTLMAAVLLMCGFSHATLVDFDSKSPVPGGYYAPNVGGSQDWQDGGATLGMLEDLTYGYYWEGFTYSDVNNPSTGGYGNQYAVYGNGTDRSGAGAYAVGYVGYYGPTTVSFGSVSAVNGFYLNNTAYAALDMINGSGFTKAFSTNDWFKLTIEGLNGSTSQGTVDAYLADFTGYTEGDDKNNYMLTDWTWVDLSGLGSNVTSLAFTLSSSDTGAFGMNTPAYFTMDELSYEAVPEPATLGLMLLSGIALFAMRRRCRT